MAYYPIFLELRNRPCLVVGGGEVAYRKAQVLIRCAAAVTLASPKLHGGLKRLVKQGKARWLKHPFRPGDLKAMELVVAATNDQPVNERVSRLCQRKGIWVNVVDQPRLCSFIVPSVVRRRMLTVAISTGGASPALSKWIRKDMEQRYGPEFGRLVKGMHKIRPRVLARVRGVAARKALFEKALKAYFRVLRS